MTNKRMQRQKEFEEVVKHDAERSTLKGMIRTERTLAVASGVLSCLFGYVGIESLQAKVNVPEYIKRHHLSHSLLTNPNFVHGLNTSQQSGGKYPLMISGAAAVVSSFTFWSYRGSKKRLAEHESSIEAVDIKTKKELNQAEISNASEYAGEMRIAILEHMKSLEARERAGEQISEKEIAALEEMILRREKLADEVVSMYMDRYIAAGNILKEIVRDMNRPEVKRKHARLSIGAGSSITALGTSAIVLSSIDGAYPLIAGSIFVVGYGLNRLREGIKVLAKLKSESKEKEG
ncbi:MAG: hypothetical protein KGH67_05075 [Candidatus Micrarchaeota archaeon]|nr:hypothetical protein [Candidatus Micrarchaeota archaeon]